MGQDPRPAALAARRCRRRRRASSPASTRAPTSPAACTRRPRTRSSDRFAASSLRSRSASRTCSTPQNINVLRGVPRSRQPRVGRARPHARTPLWRYVNVRRLFIMIEESIDEGTQWVVFEPNDEPLWARVRQSVSRFLMTQWRIGALQGTTADEAFFVVCDRTTMSPGRHRQRAADLRDRHRAGQARGVRDLPHPAEDARDRERLTVSEERPCPPSSGTTRIRDTTSRSSSPASATTAAPSAARSARSADSSSRSRRSSTATATRPSRSARSPG